MTFQIEGITHELDDLEQNFSSVIILIFLLAAMPNVFLHPKSFGTVQISGFRKVLRLLFYASKSDK